MINDAAADAFREFSRAAPAVSRSLKAMAISFDKLTWSVEDFTRHVDPDTIIINDDDERDTVTDNSGRLFATYLEVVSFDKEVDAENNPNDWYRRSQWIVMPPPKVDTPFVVFMRSQNSKQHRPTWKGFHFDDPTTVSEAISNTLNYGTYTYNNVCRPPIVVELTPGELHDHTVATIKTPYPVLRRAERVARKRHGFEI